MRTKKGSTPRWLIEVCGDARNESTIPTDLRGQEYVQVGEKLVSALFIEELMDEVNGKEIASPLVMSIPELIDDDFLMCHTECQHAVMVDCLIALFVTRKILIYVEG